MERLAYLGVLFGCFVSAAAEGSTVMRPVKPQQQKLAMAAAWWPGEAAGAGEATEEAETLYQAKRALKWGDRAQRLQQKLMPQRFLSPGSRGGPAPAPGASTRTPDSPGCQSAPRC